MMQGTLRSSVPRYLIAIGSILLAIEATSQPRDVFVIKGVVRDSASGQPIENVNVFLASTSHGVGTDHNGRYSLTAIPRGRYSLIFSRVGYELKALGIDITGRDTLVRDATLAPRLISLTDIEVSANNAAGWHRNFELFSRILLGDGPNAARCEITNPDVINFQFDPKTSIMQAAAPQPIHIVNRGLGYDVQLSISEFRWNTKEDFGYFLVYPLFAPLQPASAEESNVWRANRRTAYDGSLQLFFRSVYDGKTDEEGFVMQKGDMEDLRHDRGKYVFPEEIRVERLRDSMYGRWTFDGWFRVNRKGESGIRASYLELDRQGTLIDRLGSLDDPLSVRLLGRWAKERVSEMLPLDEGDTIDARPSSGMRSKH